MLNIYYGRASVDHEKFIFSHVDPKDRNLIIVPDQYTMEAETRLFQETGAEALMDTEVVSMSRLGYRLLNELGGSRRTFIDKNGRQMILSGVAMEQHESLQVYRGLERKTSFLEKVNDFISEIKQYNCGLEELIQIRDSVALRKLRVEVQGGEPVTLNVHLDKAERLPHRGELLRLYTVHGYVVAYEVLKP